MLKITDIFKYKGLIYATTMRDLYSRYAGSFLGALWLILPSLFMIFIYTVIFSNIMKAKLPGVENQYAYSIYLCSGIITWGIFLEVIQRSKDAFINNANLIKKSSFPHWVLFIPILLVAIFNGLVLLVIVLFFMLILDYPIAVFNIIFLLSTTFIVTSFLAVSIGAFLSIFNAFSRDIGKIADVLFQFVFWATPIVYPVTIVPEKFKYILDLNPMAYLIKLSQDILLAKEIVMLESFKYFIYPLIFATLMMIITVMFYKRTKADLLDRI